MPLAAASVNLAGQPSKVGGAVARVFGFIVLGGGWSLAAFVALVISWLGGTWTPFVVGGIIALLASIVAWALLRSGKELKKSGDHAEAATKNQAIFALANTRGGVLKAWDVAAALQLTPQEGDAILTKLAKEHPDYVTVDLDDDGNVLYRFPSIHWGGLPGMAPNAPAPMRVEAPPARSRVAPGADAAVRVDARDSLHEELLPSEAPARQKAR